MKQSPVIKACTWDGVNLDIGTDWGSEGGEEEAREHTNRKGCGVLTAGKFKKLKIFKVILQYYSTKLNKAVHLWITCIWPHFYVTSKDFWAPNCLFTYDNEIKKFFFTTHGSMNIYSRIYSKLKHQCFVTVQRLTTTFWGTAHNSQVTKKRCDNRFVVLRFYCG